MLPQALIRMLLSVAVRKLLPFDRRFHLKFLLDANSFELGTFATPRHSDLPPNKGKPQTCLEYTTYPWSNQVDQKRKL